MEMGSRAVANFVAGGDKAGWEDHWEGMTEGAWSAKRFWVGVQSMASSALGVFLRLYGESNSLSWVEVDMEVSVGDGGNVMFDSSLPGKLDVKDCAMVSKLELLGSGFRVIDCFGFSALWGALGRWASSGCMRDFVDW